MAEHLSSGFVPLSDGRAALHGTAARLCGWFGDRVRHMAIEAGAEEFRFGPAMPRSTLVRAGFFEAFPDGATSVTSDEREAGYCLAPAVCYHAYAEFAGHRFDRPVTLTAESTCFRERDRHAGGAGRLWEFTMREVVFIGAPDWVAARRDEWMSRVSDFSASLQLEGAIEPATDPFFGNGGRGKRLLQQVKGLKYELRLAADPDALAVASFNLHETFFSRRFAMTLADDSPAHSACVAFGLERWVLAFLDQRGATAAEALLQGHGTP